MIQSLDSLARDYENAIQTQQRVIDAFRKKLREARNAFDCKEIQRLNTLLRILYDEKSELEERARDLNNYLKQRARTTPFSH